MTLAGWGQMVTFAVVLTALTPLTGAYLVRVFAREPILLDRSLGGIERSLYRAYLGKTVDAREVKLVVLGTVAVQMLLGPAAQGLTPRLF